MRVHLKAPRWNLKLAAEEFGTSILTLQKRLKSVGEMPGADGYYATAQLLRALYGDFSGERLKKLIADRELTETKRAILAKEYLPREGVLNALTTSWLVIRRAIEGSSMSESEKRRTLKLLAEPVFEKDQVAR